jgi:hypothetical protein
MKNIRQNIKTNLNQTKKEKLILVREGLLYGISIERSKNEKVTINRGIVSTPNIVFHTNNTKCLVDYTNQTNENIPDVVNKFFTQLTTGMTLEFSNATYTDPNSELTSNLNGTYIFRSFYEGIANLDVVSVSNLSSSITRYDKNRFDQIPYFTANSVANQNFVTTIIKNKFGKNSKNSFNSYGVKVGDYIKIGENSTPVKITEINIDVDGNEYINIDAIYSVEDRTSLPTKIEIYIPNTESITFTPDLNDKKLGACIEYFNNVIISCTDNHTIDQCKSRANISKNIIVEITPGTFCATPETETALQTNVTENLVQVTSALVNAVTNVSNVSGPILKGTNSKNSFYGRPF